jgi:hypothetical protein
MRIRIRHHFDPGTGMEKFGSGIWYKHPRSVTLFISGSVMLRRIRTRIQERQINAVSVSETLDLKQNSASCLCVVREQDLTQLGIL